MRKLKVVLLVLFVFIVAGCVKENPTSAQEEPIRIPNRGNNFQSLRKASFVVSIPSGFCILNWDTGKLVYTQESVKVKNSPTRVVAVGEFIEEKYICLYDNTTVEIYQVLSTDWEDRFKTPYLGFTNGKIIKIVPLDLARVAIVEPNRVSILDISAPTTSEGYFGLQEVFSYQVRITDADSRDELVYLAIENGETYELNPFNKQFRLLDGPSYVSKIQGYNSEYYYAFTYSKVAQVSLDIFHPEIKFHDYYEEIVSTHVDFATDVLTVGLKSGKIITKEIPFSDTGKELEFQIPEPGKLVQADAFLPEIIFVLYNSDNGESVFQQLRYYYTPKIGGGVIISPR